MSFDDEMREENEKKNLLAMIVLSRDNRFSNCVRLSSKLRKVVYYEEVRSKK